MFLKRLGPAPSDRATPCARTSACPDIWELDDGDFAVIGTDITAFAAALPPGAGCSSEERIVRLPRRLLVGAKPHIPGA
jgi:hypothetical protein